ncbi:MAG: DEAD/DEAH box helicase [Spirochaetes bacterium]|nr:DEAD/DEAH box helicase [Spirochaetota bacterium]
MMRKSANEFFLSFLPWLETQGEVPWVKTLPGREAVLNPLPEDLSPALAAALASRGITGLYSHQAEAYRLGRAGKNFVVVTPTASGKTLCYNLPIVQSLLEDETARALFLFPTKALSQDQKAELNEVALGGSLPLQIQTYDGDTPSSLRTVARNSGRIVISNPDMLHSGILPNHAKWINFFSGLKFVVVDELHIYRGVFGSHVANVLRRLKRIAAFYGAHPIFILCSATIGNPRELAESLVEEKVELIDRNGSGTGEKTIVFYNPPLVDPVRGLRKSSALESQRIALELLKGGVKTILFSRSRLQVELIASYLSESLENPFTENGRIKVSPYRSGLLPSERRAIEKGLREGSIQGVVSTNALELGIDIGGLDAAVIAGYPGSAVSFWQQAGRAGRRGTGSMAIFVASSSPLDQYFARHPEYFLAQGPERARIDPDNAYIFVDHAKCAAFELPFSEGEAFGSGSAFGRDSTIGSGSAGERTEMTREALSLLEEEGAVRLRSGRWYWSDEGYPSETISLRSATADNVVIVDVTGGAKKVIGEMDRPSAKELLFENAVYIHLGQQYLVTDLDIDNRLCVVERHSLEYWTDSIVKTDLEVLTEDERGWAGVPGALSGPFAYSLGDVLVRSQAEKFKKLRFHTHENVGYGEIHLPPEEMQTRAVSILFPRGRPAGDFLAALDPSRAAAVLVGSARLFKSLAPAFVLCDSGDLGVSERVRDQHFLQPAIHLYDKYPGGTGLAEALSARLPDLAMAALERLSGCSCRFGCPSCIGVDLIPEGADEGENGRAGTTGPILPAGPGGGRKLVADFLVLCRTFPGA